MTGFQSFWAALMMPTGFGLDRIRQLGLERMEDARRRALWDRWLGRYIESRLQGVPSAARPW